MFNLYLFKIICYIQYTKIQEDLMKEEKMSTITNLFEGKEIRSIWDSEKKNTILV